MAVGLAKNNEDIEGLIKKGYALSVDSNHLVVRDIPYLDNAGNLQVGAIVSVLEFIDQHRVKMQDHQIYFCGSHPHELDGTPIKNLAGGPVTIHLTSDDIKVERSFSNKPPEGNLRTGLTKLKAM